MKNNAVISPTSGVTPSLVKMENIYKSFGGVTALDGVDFEIHIKGGKQPGLFKQPQDMGGKGRCSVVAAFEAVNGSG